MSIWGAAIKAATTATAAAAAKKKNSSSSSSSSKRGSSSSSSGSSSSWLDQAKANSSAWHTADAATKKNLEQANRKLYSDHGYTYNSKTGTWSAPTTSSSGGSYSGGSSSGGSSASSAVSTPDWLKQAQANSQAWHTADAATRKNLEKKNRALYTGHGYSYDSKTGTWKAPTAANGVANTVGNMLGGALSTGLNAMNAAKNTASGDHSTIPSGNYTNTDLGNTFWQAASSGSTDIDYLQSVADKRLEKAQGTAGLGQFANDQNQIAMQAYINQLKRTQEYADQYNKYYDDAREAQQQAYTQAAEQAAQQYRQLIPTTNQSYDEAARQAYINYRTAQRDLPSQLAAAGISGQGASESALVQQNNAYNSAYNQNELARSQALANIENQAANAYNTTANQGAQSIADLLAQQAQAQQNILAQQEQMRQNAIGNLYNYNNMTGYSGGTPTLDAQQTLANIAYNKRAQDMQQSQYEQSAKTDQENAMRDYYLKLWEGMGNRGATSQIAAVLGIPVGSVYGAGTYNSNYY